MTLDNDLRFKRERSERKNKIPLLVAIGLCLVAGMAIYVFGCVRGDWNTAFRVSVGAAALILISWPVSAVWTCCIRRFPILSEPTVHLVLLVLGMVILMLPISLFGAKAAPSPDPNAPPVIGVLASLYSAIQMVGFEMSLGDWMGSQALHDVGEGILFWHAIGVVVFAIACPVAAVFAAFDAVMSGLSDLRIAYLSLRESLGHKEKEIYVFHELDEHGYTLARDILRRRQKELPLLIFANVGDAEASRDETLMEDLTDYAKGKGYMVFTSLPAESVPLKLTRRAQRRCKIFYFAVSQSSSANVQTTVRIWDTLFVQLWDAAWPIYRSFCEERGSGSVSEVSFGAFNERLKAVSMRVPGTKTSQDSSIDKDLERLIGLGRRMSIHCLHTHEDDSIILDGLFNRGIEMLRSEFGLVDREGERAEGVDAFVKTLCTLIKVRLLSQAQVSVYGALRKHPLYEALEPLNVAEHGDVALPLQTLTVLIVGAGAYGIQALKTVFWLGRLARVALRIVVVERAPVRGIMQKLYAEAPEMMCEYALCEDGEGPQRGKWDYVTGTDACAVRSEVPTVRFCQMDAFDGKMSDLVLGKTVEAYRYERASAEGSQDDWRIAKHAEVVLGGEDHAYCMVCLNADDVSLSASLLLQRLFGMRKAASVSCDPAHVVSSSAAAAKVPITLRVRNADVLSSISEFARDTPSYSLWKMGFPLYTFGSLGELFSYETIAKDASEQRAMRANGEYGGVRYGEEKVNSYHCEMDYNGLSEFKKMSSRAFALSIRYKLWMLGLDESCSQDRYEEALGISDNERSKLATVACEKGYYNLLQKASDQEGGISSNAYASFEGYEEQMRAQLPILCYLADLEHVRWVAFHRALGWKDPMDFVDTRDASRIEAYI